MKGQSSTTPDCDKKSRQCRRALGRFSVNLGTAGKGLMVWSGGEIYIPVSGLPHHFRLLLMELNLITTDTLLPGSQLLDAV